LTRLRATLKSAVVARSRFIRWHRNLPLVALAVAASTACAAAACLPSVDFDGSTPDGGGEGATDAASPDVTAPPHDGGADAHVIGADAGPPPDAPETGPEGSTGVGPFADGLFWGYAETSACAVWNGALECWGDQGSNVDGELGFADEDAGGTTGLVAPTPVPTMAQPISLLRQIVMGEYHTCALFGSEAYCWGWDGSGQLGNDATANDGGPSEQAVVGLPEGGLSSLTAGSWSTCGITTSPPSGNVSNVYCWGNNSWGQLGRDLETSNFDTAVPVTGDVDGGPMGVIPAAVQLAGGDEHFCAVTSAHKILCWGSTQYYQCGPVQGALVCPQQTDQVTCTQQPLEVTLPTDPSTDPPVGVAAGDRHSCAVTKLGNVYCWGLNDSSQLGNATISTTCPYGSGTMPCTGSPVQIAVTGIQRIYAGGATTCGIDAAGSAWCWGNNGECELAQGSNDPVSTPVEILDETTSNAIPFDELSLGRYSVCGRSGGALYCWGGGVLGTATDAGTPNNCFPALVQF